MTHTAETPPAAAGLAQHTPGGAYRIDVVGEPPNAFIERQATIPEVEPLIIGVRPSYEETYQVTPGQFTPRATATDVFISAVASCMVGAFARSVEARGIQVLAGQLSAVIDSNIAKEPGGVRYVDRIHVRLHTDFGEQNNELVERAFQGFERRCWLSQTLVGSRCAVTAELVVAAE
ncbi:hypothetical protein G3I59_09155 [Amycolatopsis rubida]|uniref:OsmC family protein n=1 Tax=Amycolatopsis rubida TaxID=112413 RepID=A0ABX0BMN1_9PSEU|nr:MULTISPECIES: OsmC family protein [Amycolatopsis]MYW90771.1 hypothetical protein [Amycolatopsis rubida]NEC55754.1 hypothetical protein [Amycolatopsis rubida]OAP26174.1 OsmC-like protein [Amycolatopsis sp. M39]